VDPTPGIGKFSKTPVAISKFLASLWWHYADMDWGRTILEWHASLTFMWRLPFCTWKFRHISLCKGEKYAVLGAIVQNVVALLLCTIILAMRRNQRSEVSTSVVLGTGCLSLLENIQTIWSFTASFIFFWFYCVSLYMWLYVLYASILILYIMYSFCYVYVFLLLCMFHSKYCVSLCCSMYCLCVNVYCTTATGCQPNCSFI
jgi:hypothetical protein